MIIQLAAPEPPQRQSKQALQGVQKMAGYNYMAGMSNNAVSAYCSGIKPISKFTKADLQAAGLDLPLAFVKWLAKAGHWTACEYHHTGGTWYNKTDFFDLSELVEMISEGELDLVALKAEWKAPPRADEQRVKGQYAVFTGSRNRAKFAGHEAFTGVLRGDWIYLDGGGKKKATGNHITWENA